LRVLWLPVVKSEFGRLGWGKQFDDGKHHCGGAFDFSHQHFHSNR
jgi:hypothetical protein